MGGIKLPEVEPYVYGQPYQTADGATVITVTRVSGRGGAFFRVRPVGVFVIKDGQPPWPEISVTRRP
jgi:hypothetical protein